jgi:hypothetical protein
MTVIIVRTIVRVIFKVWGMILSSSDDKLVNLSSLDVDVVKNRLREGE